MSRGPIGWSAIAAAAAILAFQILVPPAIGLADNGDFAKITGRFNLYPAVDELRDSAFRYINLRYDFLSDSHIDTGFRSPETLLIRAALLLNRVVSRAGVFDLRAMGVVHAALFLLALALLTDLLGAERAGLRLALLALAVFVFCDVAFSAYYNSFYLDAGAFVFLMLAVAAWFATLSAWNAARIWSPYDQRLNFSSSRLVSQEFEINTEGRYGIHVRVEYYNSGWDRNTWHEWAWEVVEGGRIVAKGNGISPEAATGSTSSGTGSRELRPRRTFSTRISSSRTITEKRTATTASSL